MDSRTRREEGIRSDNVPDGDSLTCQLLLRACRTSRTKKIVAEAIIFLVFPPTLPVTSDRAKLNTALEAPVKSLYQDSGLSCGDDTHNTR